MKENLNQLIISGITGSQNEARITLVKVDATNNSAGNLFEKIAHEQKKIVILVTHDLDIAKRSDVTYELRDKVFHKRVKEVTQA